MKFLANFCDIVAEFLRIPALEESRYDFSAVTSSVVTSGVQTPVIDDSDEGIMRKLRHELLVAETCGNPSFPVFLDFVKANPIGLGRNQIVGVDFLSLVVEQIGKWKSSPIDSLNFLKFLSQLVSIEHNHNEYAIAIFLLNHKITPAQWTDADLGYHVVHKPCPFGNRSDVFRLLFALDKDEAGLHDMGLSEVVISQYLMWRDRHVTFAEISPDCHPGSGDSFVSPGMVSLMGPNSPLAASPSRSSKNQNSSAHDAREWLMVSLSALDDEGIFVPSTNDSSWKRVEVPRQSANLILGEFSLWYRPSSESQTEVKFEWNFPAHVNMEHVLGLLYNPEELGAWSPDLVGGYFGLVSSFLVTHSVEEDQVLLKKVGVFFDEPKKAMTNLIVSAGRGVSTNSVVIAIASDMTNVRPVASHRLIRSFHLGGCEVNVTTGQMKGLINFSADSIFLVAGDLLGERLSLWKALERFSHALRDLSRAHHPIQDNSMSCWLRAQFQ